MNDRQAPRGERPEYKVYRSRPGLLSRLRAPDLSGLREKLPGGGEDKPQRPRRGRPSPPRPGRRRWPRRVAIGVIGWVLVSLVAFAVSSQIQKSKLADGATRPLDGNPLLAVIPQNILVLGTDARPSGLAASGEEASERCLKAAGKGRSARGAGCDYRSDTLMVIRAGGGAFRKLSIPRDALAEIPGAGPEKINSAYALGGARLAARTVAKFLGIDIDHVAIVDFVGFRDFIDAVGGITVELEEPVCAEISGGAENGGITLDLQEGDNDLDGEQALALARARTSGDCDDDGAPDSNVTDVDRVRFQQQIISGIKGKLTSPWQLPFNFVRGPLIGWNAPKAIVSDMGAVTMPQLLLAAAIGGNSPTVVLEPTGTTAAGNLMIPQENCERAVGKLLDGDPPRTPACSPPG